MRRAFASVVLAACTIISAHAGPPEPTARTDLVRLLASSSKPVVEYCNRKVPANAAALDSAYRLSIHTMEIAGKQYLDELGSEADQPLDAEALQAWSQNGQAILDRVQRYDPQKYCNWLTGHLIEVTPEVALQQMREGYRVARKLNIEAGSPRP